ncbi:hypothetical protein FKO10_24300 (plasmid) [Salmonella enterica subsp. enterica serovar Enteritidis]|nr:hypothetical protein FKO10_24300 [Salmonella enterica subsp. enterica serovar Enteritidis]
MAVSWVAVNLVLFSTAEGTVAKLAMRQPFVLFKGLTFQKLCLPGIPKRSFARTKRYSPLST